MPSWPGLLSWSQAGKYGLCTCTCGSRQHPESHWAGLLCLVHLIFYF